MADDHISEEDLKHWKNELDVYSKLLDDFPAEKCFQRIEAPKELDTFIYNKDTLESINNQLNDKYAYIYTRGKYVFIIYRSLTYGQYYEVIGSIVEKDSSIHVASTEDVMFEINQSWTLGQMVDELKYTLMEICTTLRSFIDAYESGYFKENDI